MVGVGKGAQNGVLIKNAEAIEKLNQVDTLIVDKTGTITEGKPALEKIYSLHQDYDETKLLKYIASLNNHSEHPLAKATIKYGREQNVQILPVDEFSALTGKGVLANVDGKTVMLGNAKMMALAQTKLTTEMEDAAKVFQKQGKTVSFLAINKTVVGFTVIGDKIKESSARAIKDLQDKGIAVVMLTGDNQNTAQMVAQPAQS